IGPRGSTDLAGGWLHGCEQVAAHLDRESVSRCLLLTDGLANQGITNHGEIASHARELRRRGVITSTIGVGADFDEHLLRDMAHEGGGNFYFVEGASQIPEILMSELGEAAEVTVRNAVLSVYVPRGAEVEVLHRFRSSMGVDTRTLTVELGDLVSEQEVTAVFRVAFPTGEVDDQITARVALSHRDASSGGEHGELRWRFASHAENDAQPRDRTVDREVAAIFAARARAEATEANRHGDFNSARLLLEETARRINSYAGGDADLIGEAAALEDAVSEYAAAPMSAVHLKASFFAAESALKARLPAGRARRTER
ncbi:MAG: vWA domain-containing protein, partial [Gemmatimonadaceae bacterium]